MLLHTCMSPIEIYCWSFCRKLCTPTTATCCIPVLNFSSTPEASLLPQVLLCTCWTVDDYSKLYPIHLAASLLMRPDIKRQISCLDSKHRGSLNIEQKTVKQKHSFIQNVSLQAHVQFWKIVPCHWLN